MIAYDPTTKKYQNFKERFTGDSTELFYMDPHGADEHSQCKRFAIGTFLLKHKFPPHRKLENITGRNSPRPLGFSGTYYGAIPSPDCTWLSPVLSPPHAPHTDLVLAIKAERRPKQVVLSIGEPFFPFGFALNRRNAARSYLRRSCCLLPRATFSAFGKQSSPTCRARPEQHRLPTPPILNNQP